MGSFFVQEFFFFFGSFGAARFFFGLMLAFFIVVALLHDFFFLISLPCTILFSNCPPPSPKIWWSAPKRRIDYFFTKFSLNFFSLADGEITGIFLEVHFGIKLLVKI